MIQPLKVLKLQRVQLYNRILKQADLHLQLNLQECRSRRNEGSRWLFHRGLEQGIEAGLNYFFDNFKQIEKSSLNITQSLIEFKKEVVETSLDKPHKAKNLWSLHILEDHIDIEREDIVSGLQYGLNTTAHTLPHLLKNFDQKKGPLKEAPRKFARK
ncbi:MAG: hypothetical protein K2P81_03450 [Bacteriovoracaceae bacterium]|nr:hypothetical protein [Bacteriovoracaceae bacterium]